jgi:polar amino acid transport system permease protein
MLAYAFDWDFLLHRLPDLADGLRITAIISAIGIGGSLAIGLLGGALRAHRVPIADQVVAGYVEFVRNTPLLVQIFFLYFALPEIGIKLAPFTVAWLSLVIWGTAYNVENFRAGFESVGHNYREAGDALALSRLDIFGLITLPIGLRVALPSTINTSISVLKNSSFMVAIGYPELTDTATNIVSVTFRVFEMFFALGVVYLAVVWGLSGFMRWVERKLALPGEVR